MACIALVYFESAIIARYIRGPRISPEPNACIQRAASVAVPAIEPAPPDAVTTDRNGITSDTLATGFATAYAPAPETR